MRRPPPEPPSIRASLTRKRVLVTLVSGEGFDGVLSAQDDSGFLLMGAAGAPLEHIDQAGERSQVAGLEFVPMHRVDFIQIPGEATE